MRQLEPEVSDVAFSPVARRFIDADCSESGTTGKNCPKHTCGGRAYNLRHPPHRDFGLPYFSDGLAEAHPTREVDFRNLTLKQAQVPSSELTKLQEIVSPSKTRELAAAYERNWGNVDFGDRWEITMGLGNARRTVTLLNFQPFRAREKATLSGRVGTTWLHGLGTAEKCI